MADKIRAFEPHIRVNKDAVKPYYTIVYYDLADRVWHIGYGSYDLNYVIKWLQEEFEEVDVEFEEVKHGEWERIIRKGKPRGIRCSLCGKHIHFHENYCPNCGAKMDGDNDFKE